MARKLLFGLLIIVLVAVPLFAAACEEEVTPPGEEEEEEGPPGEEEEEEEEGDWWDEFGEPQYGGTITWRMEGTTVGFDTWSGYTPTLGWLPWFDNLFYRDWIVDRQIFPFTEMYVPIEYTKGALAESWEQPDSRTMIVHIREGVYWQDKEPVNGREFTAYDVEHHYHWLMGTGDGYTEPDPFYAMWLGAIEEVTATDDYTVVFKFKKPGIAGVWNVLDQGTFNFIEAPESIQAEGGEQIKDWRDAVGTGAWMLTDFVADTSMTLERNPNYWGYDERHPENQLPYADTLKGIVITDMATALAALRTGQIDLLGGSTCINWQQAESLAETNPEIQQGKKPIDASPGYQMRVDKAPFTDIRVRKALQMAIDREAIAEGYFGGNADATPAGMVSRGLKGFNFPYEEWPQELKDEYSYNPERARELLAEAAADGVFEVNELGGFDTNIVASTTHDLPLLEIVQSYFKDIGVDMEIEVMEQASFLNFIYAYKQEQMISHQGTKTFPPFIMISTYQSGNMRDNTGAVNDPGYDAIVEQFYAALTEDEAAQCTREADRCGIEQHWTIIMPAVFQYLVWQPYLKGYSGEAMSWNNWQYFNRIWIDQDLKESMGR